MVFRGFKHHLKYAVLGLSLVSSSSYGAELCQYIFSAPQIRAQSVDFGLRRSTQERYAPVELVNYRAHRDALRTKLTELNPARAQEIRHLLDAMEFFDYQHTAPKLLDNFLAGKKNTFDFTKLYDQPSEPKAGIAFKSFVAAREYLIQEQPPVTPELLQNIHRLIMKGGVEGVRSSQLGNWRDGHWIGNAVGVGRVTAKERATIENNPYLYFEPSFGSNTVQPSSVWSKIQLWIKHRNTSLEVPAVELFSGKIHYPNVIYSKRQTVDLIKDVDPNLHKEILKLQDDFANRRDSKWKDSVNILEERFTAALVKERFQRFHRDRQTLGEVKVGVNEHNYIDLVADFQRDLVAIHPMLNGNGRTTRLFMNYLLTKEGLPPVRLVDPFLDVQVPRELWAEYVHKGVINTAQLYKDVLFRVENNLTVEHSAEILYPGLKETVEIALKKQNSKDVKENHMTVKVEGDQFNAFMKTLFEMHPDLKTELQNDRLRTMSRIAELFVEYHRSKTIRYIHDKDGERTIGLRLVEVDFIESFGVTRALNKKQWDNKIQKWYEDMLVWRGLSNRQREYTTQELLNYFRQPTTHLVSNRVLQRIQQGADLQAAIKMDFADFNKELLSGDMVQMAVDHHRSGPLYGQSYGYSTSKREVVGKAFAMGAMVVGEYGKHNDPTLQAKLKDRINVASFRALKDVDLGRLKAFDPEFSYVYGRQAEVMGIGGTDPDAVMLIQRIDAAGKVTQTFLRNVENPNEVLVIKGRFVPGEGETLTPDRIIEKHILFQTNTDKKTKFDSFMDNLMGR